MKVFIHVPVLKRIVGSLLGGVDGSVQMLKLGREAHAHFERVCHADSIDIAVVVR